MWLKLEIKEFRHDKETVETLVSDLLNCEIMFEDEEEIVLEIDGI